MTAKAKKKNKEEILDIYMEYVLSQGIDVSVEDLCADTKLDKYNFYDYFDSIPHICLLYTSPSPRDRTRSRMPSSA